MNFEIADSHREAFQKNGFLLLKHVLDASRIKLLIDRLEADIDAKEIIAPHGIRLALSRFEWVRELAESPALLDVAQELLGTGTRPVKGIIFDKIPASNWKVPSHQDLTIAVDRRIELSGFGPWSIKEGVHHVQPPLSIMQSIVTLRLHLDPCPATNGALRVVPRSHCEGRLDHERMLALKSERGEITCEAEAGDILMMSPLIIHSSAPSLIAEHRRVIHLEYSAYTLPAGMRWHEQ